MNGAETLDHKNMRGGHELVWNVWKDITCKDFWGGGGLSQVAMEMISRLFCITFEVTDGEGRRLLIF